MKWKFQLGEIIKRGDGVEFVVVEAFTGLAFRRASGAIVWRDPPMYRIAQCGLSWSTINVSPDDCELCYESTGERAIVDVAR